MYQRAVFLMLLLVCGVTAEARADAPRLGEEPAQAQDLGTPRIAGAVSVSEQGSTITVKAGGVDIWESADEGHFLYRRMAGDLIAKVRVDSLDRTDEWAKAGLMLREGVEQGARNVFLAVTPGNGTTLQRRKTADEETECEHEPDQAAPVWLKVERDGDTLTGFVSEDGRMWRRLDTVRLALADELLVGLAVTSHNSYKAAEAVFSGVSLESVLNIE